MLSAKKNELSDWDLNVFRIFAHLLHTLFFILGSQFSKTFIQLGFQQALEGQ